MISVRSAVVGIGLAMAVAISTSVSAQAPAAGGSGDLSITVNYRGKGPVGKGHEIGVFLYGVKGDPNEMFKHGSPIKPAAVTAGARITITFDDSYPSK